MLTKTNIRRYIYSIISSDISCLTKYADRIIQWLPTLNDDLTLFNMIDNEAKSVLPDDDFTDISHETEEKTVVLINGSMNHDFDIQGLLLNLYPRISRTCRVIIVAYNPYVSWLYLLANKLNLRRGELPTTFLTRVDLENIAEISGFSITRTRNAVFFPWRLFGLGDLVNRLFPCIPLVKMVRAYLYCSPSSGDRRNSAKTLPDMCHPCPE